jgi:4-hydroxy-3-methylbut-2-en-1-yl diphosphate synthase IspG/GcpE
MILQAAGADIVRVSVPGFDEAKAFKEIKNRVNIPLVADIHFDYKIALEVADSADCLSELTQEILEKNQKLKKLLMLPYT